MKKPTKPKLTVPALIGWLRKRSPAKKYSYIDNCNCLIGQFVKSQGFKNVVVWPRSVEVDGKGYHVPAILYRISVNDPMTFGAALKRARSAQR